MKATFWRRLKNALLIFCLVVAAAGWGYVIYSDRRSKDPVEIVKKHFVFYPQYSHGVWREGECPGAGASECRDVTYTIPVSGCGDVTFDWRVFPGEDADATWTYRGPAPKVDESKYPFYAVLNEDSRFIDSPALGTALPAACQVK
jgi:hypothetical protein